MTPCLKRKYIFQGPLFLVSILDFWGVNHTHRINGLLICLNLPWRSATPNFGGKKGPGAMINQFPMGVAIAIYFSGGRRLLSGMIELNLSTRLWRWGGPDSYMAGAAFAICVSLCQVFPPENIGNLKTQKP